MGVWNALKVARTALEKHDLGQPTLGIVLGSGLGELGTKIENCKRVPYEEIPGMPHVSVAGHLGELLVGELEGVRVACLSGRAHYYEGHHMNHVVFGVRLLGLLGIKGLLLTNAAGALRQDLGPGDLMLIEDHIHSFFADNPLRGPNVAELGTRFPDMTEIYDRKLRSQMLSAAEETNQSLKAGVYVGVPGPSYETPAEVRMLGRVGADAVGMSTTAEAIAARHMGVRVVGISCISNHAAGITGEELHHDEVKEVALAVGGSLETIVRHFLRNLRLGESP
jgi:purine-nucleoside phosphorylase